MGVSCTQALVLLAIGLGLTLSSFFALGLWWCFQSTETLGALIVKGVNGIGIET
jgi:hypothetical protein